MAAIALKLTAATLLCTVVMTTSVRAQDAPDVRTMLGQVASALTANDPSDAMQPFSKTLPDYSKLRNYFTGLTNGFSIVNEIDVLDQEGPQATVRWAMTVSSDGGNHSTHRVAEIHLRLRPEKKKWKIVEFSPISLFDPEQAQTPTAPTAEPSDTDQALHSRLPAQSYALGDRDLCFMCQRALDEISIRGQPLATCSALR